MTEQKKNSTPAKKQLFNYTYQFSQANNWGKIHMKDNDSYIKLWVYLKFTRIYDATCNSQKP